jgi:predicted DNA-binding protein with PD1-like motif
VELDRRAVGGHLVRAAAVAAAVELVVAAWVAAAVAKVETSRPGPRH